MAIKYRAIERGKPGVPGSPKKWYATTVSQGQSDVKELIESIEKMCTLTGADIRAVIYALVDVILRDLANGRIVRLDDLGSLRMSINSSGVNVKDEVGKGVINKARTIFTPGPRLRNMLKTVNYVKV